MPFGSGPVRRIARFFRDIPIRLKVILIIGLTIGFAILVTGISVLVYEGGTFKPRSLEKARIQAQILSEVVVPPLLFNDSGAATNEMSILGHWHEIVSAAVYDAQGNFFAGYQRETRTRQEIYARGFPIQSFPDLDIPVRAPDLGAIFKPRSLTFTAPISGNGPGFIGTVWVNQELPPLYARLPQYGIMFGVVTISLLALAVLLGFAMKYSVSMPITSLVGTALSVIEKQDYSLRVQPHGRDEIGNLSEVFNRMLQVIEQRDGELRLANVRNEALLNTTIDGVALEDAQGRFLDVNPACCKLLGFSRQEMLGLGMEVLDELDTPAIIENRFREIRAKGRGRYETRLRTKDGRLLDVEVATTPLQMDGYRFLNSFRDVTERKLSERSLLESEERFSKAFHANPMPMSIIRISDGKFVNINESMVKLLGFERKEIIGRTSLELGILEPEQRALILKIMDEQGAIFNLELKLGSKSGEKRNVLTSVESIDVGGEKCFLSTFNDITQRMQTEEQLRQSQKMEAVGRLAGGIAHDFNNLLTAINGYSSLALQGMDSAHPLFEYLREILKSGERASGLTKQLLAYSRKQILEPKNWDLNLIVKDMQGMLTRVIGEDIELVSDLRPEIGPVKVDRGQVEQIILNLSINSRDAMPQGGRLKLETARVQIDASFAGTHPDANPGPYVKLSVMDTGIGMTPEVKARLFEPFFTTKDVNKGTGLGLSVAYGIVKQSGGFITFESEPGRGTTFRIYFPEMPRILAEPGISQPKESQEAFHGKETILLVEDEGTVRKFARHALEARGFKVIEAGHGLEAIKAVEEKGNLIDLVLTDVIMPDIGGMALAERIHEINPALSILFMSGYPEVGLQPAGKLKAGENFLQKPFSPSELISKVREVLERKAKRLAGGTLQQY